VEEREGSEKERKTGESGKGRKGTIIQNSLSFLRAKLWKGETKVDVALRTIHTSWMLWLVAVLFTLIISPLAMRLYGYSISGVLILAVIFGGAYFGYRKGDKIIKTYFNVRTVIIKDKEQLAAHDLWIARISLLIIALILFLDVASVAAESYYDSMITQYYVYTASVILLVITTMLLGRSLTKMIKRGKG
jgi:hypothetical protein